MKAKRRRFPMTVKDHSCAVKVYRDRKPSGTYYRVVYHDSNKIRHRLNYQDPEKAIAQAKAKAAQLSRLDGDALLFTGRDRHTFGRALDAIKKTGKELDDAAREYAEAHQVLAGVSVLDAAKFYVRYHGQGLKRKAVREAVDEMIAAKKLTNVSGVYLADLRYRLGLFADRFHCDLSSVTPDDVREFFDDLELSARSFNNFICALKTFFGFAMDRGWLSKEADMLASVKRRKDKKSPVEIFTPEEVSVLLNRAPPELARCIALGAFAGLRSEEILRLEWADVMRRPGFIEVAAHKAKTAARRLVPISNNLLLWLNSARTNEGLVWPHTKATYFKNRLALANKKPKLTYKPNALRHSYISYRLAEVQDVNRVALEAGNSPQMIFRHYRELATPEQAKTWFAIVPDDATNIVPAGILRGS